MLMFNEYVVCVMYIKLYLTKLSERKMCYTDIHFTVDPFTFNTDCMCNLLYMTITHYQKCYVYRKIEFIFTLDLDKKVQ